jgi:ferredoxin-NADP reductase
MKLTLVQRKQEAPEVESFIFEPAEPLEWKAGQYLHYTLPHEHMDGRGDSRWFTIAAAPFEKRPMITTRYAGSKGSSFKNKLFSLEPGAAIEATGPEGDFTVEDESAEFVFIAGGIGITPFHSILKQADHDGRKLDVTLLYAGRDEHAVYKEELDSFARTNPNLSIHYIMAPDIITEAVVKQYVPDLGTPFFYVSGPEPMVKSLADMLTGIGVGGAHIKLDDFPGYATY